MTKYFFPSHPAALYMEQSRLAELHLFSCLAVIILNEHFASSETKNNQLLSQKCLWQWDPGTGCHFSLRSCQGKLVPARVVKCIFLHLSLKMCSQWCKLHPKLSIIWRQSKTVSCFPTKPWNCWGLLVDWIKKKNGLATHVPFIKSASEWRVSCLRLFSIQQLPLAFWAVMNDFDMTIKALQRKVSLSLTPGAWIFLFHFVLWPVCMLLCLSFSLLFHLDSTAFHPLNTLCNLEQERFLYLAHFPRVFCLTQTAVLGCKTEAFLSLPAAAPRKM